MSYTQLQLSVSTAEEERAYFYEPQGVTFDAQPDLSATLPAGVYRVVEGSLCRVVAGVPPGFPARPQGGDKRSV